RSGVAEELESQGCNFAEFDQPYAAMAEFCRKPQEFAAIILNLNGIYREELAMIGAIRARFPRVEVWLSQAETRAVALIESLALGAAGVFVDGTFKRVDAKTELASD